MKKILAFQWFDCKDSARRAELKECIQHNLSLDFDEFIIFNDSTIPEFTGEKIRNIESNTRLTFKDWVMLLNDSSNHGSLICLTNTDIKLDPNLPSKCSQMSQNQLIALSRYEKNGELSPNPWATQDTWVAISQPIHNSIIYQSGIPLGVPGCENRLADLFFNIGFEVINPSLDIFNKHIQKIDSIHQLKDKVSGIYLMIPTSHFQTAGSYPPPMPMYFVSSMNKAFQIGAPF